MEIRLFFAIIAFSFYQSGFTQTTLIAAGSNWKYNDSGTDLGDAWRPSSYNDLAWSNGNSELGYGDGDENTVVSYGGSSSNKHTTTYFRKTISIADPSIYTYLELDLVCDDGCVVYVNDYEVYRQDMPSGAISYSTFASSTIAWPFEDDWNSATFSSLVLQPGNNTIAVEVHQDEPTSSDISFNFSLQGFSTPQVVNVERGPYLQQANQNEIYVCWRTDVATDSKVSYGTNELSLTSSVVDPNYTTDHFVKITGLAENTKFFYEIANSSGTFSNANLQYFKTHPIEGADDSLYRFWVIGDAGMANGDQDAVTNAFVNYNNQKHLDGWIMLGDNAYESGFDGEYQVGVFEAYPQILPNTVLWPAPGNHDYNNHIPFSPDPAYYDIFHLPVNAEAGGVASGTEKYYSWNFGNVHFISLDSYDEDRGSTDPMATWLSADLAANTQPWVVVYWHHPPYTKGSHDSDNWLLDGELIDMRENILPILESYGVDLVLNGHSHSYERSNLIDGHYDVSGTFDPGIHLKDPGSGDYVNDCPYIKNSENGVAHSGTVYAVVGCSGKLSGTSSGWPHPVMESYASDKLGSMIIEVKGNRMDCKFITSAGAIYDQFTIVKDPGGFSTIEVCQGEQVTLTPSWSGNANWEPSGIWSDSYTFDAFIPSTYFAEDSLGCITDTFEVVLLAPQLCGLGFENSVSDEQILISNLIQSGDNIQVVLPSEICHEIVTIQIFNSAGIVVTEQKIQSTDEIINIQSNQNQSAGMYYLRISSSGLNKCQFISRFTIY
jgi:hypothetical protein